MNKFVKCIDNTGAPNIITIGKVYEVLEEDDEFYCHLVGVNKAHGRWNKTRFKVMTGLLVRCINAESSDLHLKKGEIYAVKTETDEFYGFAEITDSRGGLAGWDKERFEIVQQPITSTVAPLPKTTHTSTLDIEEERAWNYFKRARPNECKCGAPLPCHYHS